MPHSNQEIVDQAIQMYIGQKLTFTANHDFARFEGASLTQMITEQRGRRDGDVFLQVIGREIIAECRKLRLV